MGALTLIGAPAFQGGLMFQAILGALTAIPKIVDLLQELIIAAQTISAKIEQVRFDADLKDAFEKAKSNYDTRKLEALLGRKII